MTGGVGRASVMTYLEDRPPPPVGADGCLLSEDACSIAG